MKILRFEAENVKRLKAVTITPDGNLVVIGGDNAQGKTSVLDAIQMALGGGKEICERPIRDGQTKAEITLNLGELTVTRKFTAAGGPSLIVKSADGVKLSSPQDVLDRLTSRITFDPLAFQRMKPNDQAETLRKLVGIDFSELDAERKRCYDQRTGKNRDAASQKARLDGMTLHPTAPTEEVSVADLSQELQRATEANANSQKLWDQLLDANDDIAAIDDSLKQYEAQLKKVQEAIKEKKAERAKLIADRDAVKAKAEASKTIDTAPILAKIQSADEVNRCVRENAAYRAEKARQDEALSQAKILSDRIEAIDKEKGDTLANAKFPISGLSFDDTGVTYNGLPFSQSSGAEQLRVSVAMGIAMNPKLKVLLIRDGSLLDDENLATIAEMAKEHDAQVWLERVSKGAECSVIIEDGSVA